MSSFCETFDRMSDSPIIVDNLTWKITTTGVIRLVGTRPRIRLQRYGSWLATLMCDVGDQCLGEGPNHRSSPFRFVSSILDTDINVGALQATFSGCCGARYISVASGWLELLTRVDHSRRWRGELNPRSAWLVLLTIAPSHCPRFSHLVGPKWESLGACSYQEHPPVQWLATYWRSWMAWPLLD